MKGKYSNLLSVAAAWCAREILRLRLSRVVEWKELVDPEPGCTVVIGMCSRLPDVLAANLRCLAASRWAGLKAVVIAVDAVGLVDQGAFERAAQSFLPELPVRFVYYSTRQSAVAEQMKLPFVYSWMSWCIAIATVRTAQFLIHDYDALVLGPALGERHREFIVSKASVQGIRWYDSNGVLATDRLCTTFELFCNSVWFRSLAPIDLFNKIRVRGSRSIDFDTALDVQDRLLTVNQRQVVAMDEEQLVHPSQMIHQYTMFRRRKGTRFACFSMPMIPFFSALGGNRNAIPHATHVLDSMPVDDLDLVGDGTRVSLEEIDAPQVDWALKQMVQACLRLSIGPSNALYAYGSALYRSAGVPEPLQWQGDFTPQQRTWIETSAHTRQFDQLLTA